MADATIRAFCAQQRELLELELQSEQDEAATNVASEQDEARRSHVLHHLQAPDVSLGLYGRTVVRLESATGTLLPAHRFTTGDQVEIRSKAASKDQQQQHPGGVINEVTDTSISVALFSTTNRKTKKGASKNNQQKEEESDDDDALLGASPYTLLPKSSIEVHKKLLLALGELEKKGTDHPVAGAVVRALFDPPPSNSNDNNNERTSSDTTLNDLFNNTLDESQRAAIAFALDRARPVALIHGPPGSGKTSSVVELIQQAIHSYGYSKILVTAPSNVAVDNVLARLVAKPQQPTGGKTSHNKRSSNQHRKQQQQQLRVVRLGHPARLQTNILPYSLEALVHGSDETQIVADVRRELEQLIVQRRRRSPVIQREISALRKEVRVREEKVVTGLLGRAQVILATCVGAGNTRLLRDLDFDLVVIDEAAQSLEAACWIPALQGRKLVLAGDHCQLPPTIKSNNRTVQEGLGTTMFERLMQLYGDDQDTAASSRNGRVSRMLQVQYRMNQKIADWASQALYGGALQTHTSVKDRTLGQLDGIATNEDDDNDDISKSPLLLIDTAGCDMYESVNAAGSRFNEGEATLVGLHARRLLDMGIRQDQIAIITPYNGQVEILRTALLPQFPKLEIRSVDGFQGGEKEAVVLSLVRSSDRGGMSGIGFLRDDRRLNVAVTRAKRHCCVICDSETVSQSAFVKNLVSWIEEHGEQRSALEYLSHDPNNNNEGQIESDLAQAQIEMEKLMSQLSDATNAKNESKNKAARESKPSGLDDEKRVELLEKIKTFVRNEKPGAEMKLSTELSKADRKAVHELAEELGVGHYSTGVEGVNRRITISIPGEEKEVKKEAGPAPPLSAADVPSPTPGVEEADDDEIAPEQEENKQPTTSFTALVEDEDSDDDELAEDSQEKEPESTTTNTTEDASPSMNSVLGNLAKERAQRQAQQRRETAAAATQSKKKNTKKKKKGQKLGGTKKPPPKPKDTVSDDADLDDMAFLDAQIDKAQNSHGRTFEGKGSYRTVMNGILLSKPAPVAKKKKDARASAALQDKLKKAQSDRRAKGKKK